MTKLNQLRKKRDKARRVLVNALEPEEDSIRTFNSQQDKPSAYEQIASRLSRLHRLEEDSIAAHRELYDHLEVDDPEFDEVIKDNQELSNRCARVDSFVEKHRVVYNQSQQSQINASARNQSHNSADQHVQFPPSLTYRSSMQLPKLEIPKFSGDALEWNQFHDNFSSAIDSDDRLSEVQKLTYLKSFLTDEAKRTIDGLQTTQANYKIAFDLLKERYGQPKMIIDAHMRSLWALPAPNNDPTSLRRFHDEVETTIRGLRVLHMNESSYGALLIPMLLDKLPITFQQQLARNHGDDDWTLTELTAAMRAEIRALSVGNKFSTLSCDDETDTKSTVAAFYTNTHAKKPHKPRKPAYKPPAERKCVYCQEMHNPTSCVKVATPELRLQYVKTNQLCFNCLGSHKANSCKSKYSCKICKKRHHTSLHRHNKQSNDNSSNNSGSETPPVSVNFTHASQKLANRSDRYSGDRNITPSNPPNRVLLKTATIPVSYRGKMVYATALFDEGADRSFVTHNLAQRLNANVHFTEQLRLKSFNNPDAECKSVPCTTLQLHTRDGQKKPIDVLYVKEISDKLTNVVTTNITNMPHLRGLNLAQKPMPSESTIRIDILIGADKYWDYVRNHVIRGPGPTAVDSVFGYLLSGPVDRNHVTRAAAFTGQTHVRNTRSNSVTAFHFTAEIQALRTSQVLDKNIASFWDLESIGIREQINQDPVTVGHTEQYKQYSQNCLDVVNGRFSAKLPWKPNHDPLPTNYYATEQRTRNMVRKLPRDIIQAYDKVITDQLDKGYIEKVVPDNNNTGHYLPHRAIKRESSASTPIRVVYDCSAKSGAGQPSLNDCLEIGPHLLNDLTGILLRFRANPVAITSDIEKAFLQIGLSTEDRQYTKFLWLSDIKDVNSDFSTYQFCSVLFGASPSPFILNAAIKTLIDNNTDVPAANDLQQNIYVDDVVTGSTNTSEAIQYYHDATQLLATRGFNLRSWSSNDAAIRELAAHDGRGKSDNPVTVLGMKWDTNRDILQCKQIELPSNDPLITKRDIVSYTASLYDPLGLLTPAHIAAKRLIQTLWKQNQHWDTPISDKLRNDWEVIAENLHSASKINVRRRYFNETDTTVNNEVEIHAFADASDKAYGGVVYVKSGNGTSLAMSKTRVTPVNNQTLTLPRLELMGAVIATRLSKFVSTALSTKYNVAKQFLWSDSQIVLHWLNARGKQDTFTANRVSEIVSLPQEFKYVPTKCNPADLLTRGITSKELRDSELWWKGPPWLGNRDSWPTCELFDKPNISVNHVALTPTGDIDFAPLVHQDIPATYVNKESMTSSLDRSPAVTSQTRESLTRENTPSVPVGSHNASRTVNTKEVPVGLQYVINLDDYNNNYNKLLRITAYVLRFVQLLKSKEKCTQDKPSATELNNAEIHWITDIQHEHFADIFVSTKNDNKKYGHLRSQLKLFIAEDKLLRLGGRLQYADLPYDTKHPILLPRDHQLTRLIVRATHDRIMHRGPQSTVNALRDRYWINSIRRVVNHVLHKCVVCRKVSGPAYAKPISTPLPECRVTATPPFRISGIDYTGALYVRSAPNKTVTKAYVCLFTCATTRAVHLELVPDMSTRSFLLAFRRFAARRSTPSMLISDNATTFISAAHELRRLMNDPEVQALLAHHRTMWKFIPKRAPWVGGFYERMIGITKSTLKKVLGKACVTFDELQTILTEVESVINDRPLTHIASHADDLVPLTPSHLMIGRNVYSLPYDASNHLSDPIALTHHNVNLRFEHLAKLQRQFGKRWSAEYLTALRERHTHTAGGVKNNTIKVGDIVLVHSDVEKRVNWHMAKVTRLLPGKDGLVRVVEIKTKLGKTNRPVNKLYLLETSQVEEQRTSAIQSPPTVPDVDNEQLTEGNPTMTSPVTGKPPNENGVPEDATEDRVDQMSPTKNSNTTQSSRPRREAFEVANLRLMYNNK
ncbi:uncharacterized protein LOC100373242 [Saccoglossus kowalevskii]|uniref:Uncharacterized protein LOC100373242 n=1 Tax=Saccoglossus kowalevskii TaxID=10224 RepID=A0ABM0H178_SACKO|nr:PREDICTED: uncharacterized protein LOC100373242 [Saccoglossus kowalevskii]